MTRSAQTEKEFMRTVIGLARRCGWLVYHTHDSRRSESGFPDLVMVREHSVLFVELKSEDGKVSIQQQCWLNALVGAGEDARTWRPSEWPEIEKTVSGYRQVRSPPRTLQNRSRLHRMANLER